MDGNAIPVSLIGSITLNRFKWLNLHNWFNQFYLSSKVIKRVIIMLHKVIIKVIIMLHKRNCNNWG